MTTEPITFSSTIYETPDTWGSITIYGDYESMTKTVKSLRYAGDDWGNTSIDECATWRLIQTNGALALYEKTGMRYPSVAVFQYDHNELCLIEHYADAADAAEDHDWITA